MSYPDTLHAIADWSRVAEVVPIAITSYSERDVVVHVRPEDLRRTMAGAMITITHQWGADRGDHLQGPDLGGWHLIALEAVEIPRTVERVTL